MSTNPAFMNRLQRVEIDRPSCSDSKPKSAADCTPEFHGRVVRTFAETLDMRETARRVKIPRWLVNEILHARDFVRPKSPMSARSLTVVERAA